MESTERFVIEGGQPLGGEVRVGGAKNAALPIMAAALLTDEPCIVDDVPIIEDVRTTAALLTELGCAVDLDAERHRITVCAAGVNRFEVPRHLAKKMRASFLVTGPLLARFGQVKSPPPGGCAIGSRPVNVDVNGFREMGARIRYVDAAGQEVTAAPGETITLSSNEVLARGIVYEMTADRLRGDRQPGLPLYLDYPSHTGTENLLMAACLARGRTVLEHASAEPEVEALARVLNRMGASITGAGTSRIVVDGIDRLYGVHCRLVPDRIEAGTFAIAAAITGGDVQIQPVVVEHMDPLTHKLEQVGFEVAVDRDERTYRVRGRGELRAVEVQTLHFPGFPTDLQAPFSAMLTQARGISIVHERVYDGRLGYVEELRKLGADVRLEGQKAAIKGPTPLRGAVVNAGDIRAGAALTLAGLAADGVTEVLGVQYVSRGYERLDEKLRGLGAKIESVV